MSSLSDQLAQIAANNSTVALDRKRRQKLHSASLIYNSKTAATQDYDTVFDNAIIALDSLIELDSRFELFKKTLFSETSINIDRNVQTEEENNSLNKAINGYLLLASSMWHLTPTLHATEWLVRKFQIHILNAEMLLLTTLNYYQTPAFKRILNIIKLPHLFAPLSTYTKGDKIPTNLTIVKLFNDLDFLKLYVNHMSGCINQTTTYTNQLLFTTCCVINVIAANSTNEPKLNLLVPLLLELAAKLLSADSVDCQIAAHTILVVFATALPLSKTLILAATETILANLETESAKKSALIAICKLFQTLNGQGNIDQLPAKLYQLFDKRFSFGFLNKFLMEEDVACDKFITSYVRAIARYDHSKLSLIVKLLKISHLENYELRAVIIDSIHLSELLEDKSQLIELFEYFISINEKLVTSCLKALSVSPEIFEIRLTTSLFSSHNMTSQTVTDLEAESIVGKNNDIPDFKTFIDKNSKTVYTKATSLLSESDEIFNKLLSLFTEAVGKKYSAGQFLNVFFTTLEARITFLLRVIVSPAAPIAVRHIASSNISKSLNNIDKESNLFTLVPCLIVALSDVSKNVRIGVKKILSQIAKRPFTKHYFFSKKIYGEKTSLPLLAPKDGETWLKNFLENYIVDNYDLSRFFIPKKNDKIYLLFWANNALTIPLPYGKIFLLRALNKSTSSPSSYSQLFEGFISIYLNERDHWETGCKLNKTSFYEFEKSIVNLISLKEKNQFMIEFIIKSLNSEYEQLSNLVAEKVLSVFDSLKTSFQLQIAQSIIDTTAASEQSYDSVATLQSLPINTDVLNAILKQNKINMDTDVSDIPKRRRRTSSANKSAFQKEEVSLLAEAHIRKITIILETLDKRFVKATPELLYSLFSLLADLEALDQAGGLPVLYAQETLASCMLNIIESLKKEGCDSLKNIRSDILVSAIRNSPSPQLQNKLLLVVGALASLSPETILHSIMPIFTFMGAHSIRQDDAFTIRVVEKTILTVVPALLNNKEVSSNDEAEFLLMSFTTALQHVPKHRRVQLFFVLIKALGSATAIGPFFFLVAHQYTHCVEIFKLGEAKSIIEFSKSLLSRFSVSEQLHGVTHYFTLLDQLLSGFHNDEKKILLQSDTLFSNGILNKNSSELFTFIQQAFNFIDKILQDNDSDYYHSNGSLKMRIYSCLLDNTESKETGFKVREDFAGVLESVLTFINDSNNYFKSDKERNVIISVDQKTEIRKSLFSLMNNTLKMLPINDFVESTLPLLTKSSNKDIKYHIALVIGTKFESETQSVAPSASLVIKILLERISAELEYVNVAQVMLNTMSSMIARFGSRLDSTLVTKALALTTKNLQSEKTEIKISSLTLISNAIQILGVKSIAFYPKVVPVTINIFKQSQSKEKDSLTSPLQLSIILLFANLVKSIPSFLVSNLGDILSIIFFANEVEVQTRLAVLQLIIKNVESREVLKVLAKSWTTTVADSADSVAISLYLSALEGTTEELDKRSATSQSPVFFKLLLSLFEYRSTTSFDNNTVSRIEATVYQISNAYVLKMNDKVFRPSFVLLVKWAFDGEGVGNASMDKSDRLIAFFKFFNKLQENLKGIITSYFTYLLEPTTELLKSFIKKDITNVNLHRLILNSLISSFKYDRDEYWKSTSRFELICETLVDQLKVIENVIGKYLAKAISSLAVNNSGAEEHNQIMNKALSNHMKATCSSREKLWAVRSLKLIYSKVGESWLTLLPQLVPTIAELLEDDDEEVEREVRTGLVTVVENVLGEPFDKYLD
ncbi:snoRNA-binding rRNA-processing protein UTP10 KNAG_0B01640 [Huiozyma naganishii CBS 8797]|uniref:U3 small nucleolar RNA-associated protein 10 n=1 Tax=Huiozyma naganishii (strain ATCC MYA-139 / BCRC 22969 / CBS 8797 / KCTC 17520 / NBRC 10181 / NCYC 3082 / Yp74L-3) TaxID=1071383 RepID=J7R1D0_HUIN7|nr:hypothetical protein KNAG_0B01640 [Kazachstania naganishii CBS 8797]CCK68610.1 hypothetical protein KNAG_0B01640 [Kazachstania naganishii CBS 8797]